MDEAFWSENLNVKTTCKTETYMGGMDASGSGKRQVAGSCERGMELSSSVKGEAYLH
jgi:hypothetical protein